MLEKQDYLHNILKGLIADTSPVNLICLLRKTAYREASIADTQEDKKKWLRKARLLDAMLERFGGIE